ncbi:MAG: DUF805 domain-containing protein, partial [Bacteroidetes bacterium]|nr:DUF805 domain-containing protein [Bacteroidota bacterium]
GILVNIWIIFNFIQAMKRMHDINKSGFFALIPFYNIILAFTKGTEGVNKFGESPKSNFQTSPK